jgi:DNA-binding transcriptional LysR family regulator
VLLRAEDASRVARAFAEGERGELHLGYSPSPTVELLPRILHAYQSEAPGVRVVLHDMSPSEMVEGLRSGKLQAALVVKLEPKTSRGLVFEELGCYPVCVAVPRAHKLGRAKAIQLSQLAREPLVVYSRSDYPDYHELLTRVLGPIGTAPVIAEEHDSATSLIAAVEAGRGLAIVPSSFACLAGPRLRVVKLLPAPSPVVVGVAYDRRTLNPTSERFLKLLHALPKASARS